MVLAEGAKLHAVRDAVGPSADDAMFFDMSVHGRNPARVLPALQSFADGHRDRRLRVIAEPVAADLSLAARAEAELNELILGLPSYRAWHATMSCLYDASDLGPRHDRRPRGRAIARGCRSRSSRCLMQRFGRPLPPSPPDANRMSADVTTLSELRRTVGRLGERAGLDAERIDDLVYAVNEVVTNSICHGEGRARVLVWFDVARRVVRGPRPRADHRSARRTDRAAARTGEPARTVAGQSAVRPRPGPLVEQRNIRTDVRRILNLV